MPPFLDLGPVPKIAIALPALTYDIAVRCLNSIDTQFWKDVMVVDNTPDQGFKMASTLPQVYNSFGDNWGLPASWNECIRQTIDQKYDYLVFLSASEVFEYGMRDLIGHIRDNLPLTGLRTNRPAWHCVVLSRQTLETVGLFDENFWPAYQEDTDYIYRMKLAGLHDRYDELNQMPMVNVAARTTGISLSIKEGKLEVDHEAHKEYYIRKWGGWDGEEKFTHPYNDKSKGIDYWKPTI